MEATENQSAGSPRAGGRFRILRWVSAGAVVIVVIVLLGGPVYLSSEAGRKFIVSRINRSIDGQVELGDLSVGWFKGIRLSDVSFADNKGVTSFRVKSISARPKLGALLRGNLVFSGAVVETPQVVMNIQESAAKPGTGPGGRSQTESSIAVAPVGDMEVKQGSATVNYLSATTGSQTVEFRNIESKIDLKGAGQESLFDVAMVIAEDSRESQVSAAGKVKRAGKKWTLKGTSGDFDVKISKLELSSLKPLFALAGKRLDAEGQLNADAQIKVSDGRFDKVIANATLKDFKQIVAGKETTLSQPVVIDTSISTVDDVWKIERLSFESAFCTVHCGGDGKGVSYDATGDLKGLRDFGGQFFDFGEYDFAGTVSTKGQVSFTEDGPVIKGEGYAEKTTINKGTVKTPVTSANLGYDLSVDTKNDVVQIRSAKLLGDIGRIELVDSVIPMGGKAGDMNVGVSADVDLEKIQPFGALAVDIPEGMKISGRFTGDGQVGVKEGVYHVVTDKASIANLLIQKPDSEPFKQQLVKIAADVLCDVRQKELTVKDLQVESSDGESLIRVTRGQVSRSDDGGRTKVEGTFEAEYDLAAVSAMAFAFVPRGLKVEGKRKTNLDFSSEYAAGSDGFLSNLNGRTSVGFDKADYRGMRIGRCDMGVEATNGLLQMDLPAVSVNGGEVKFSGNINFREKPAVLRLSRPVQLASKVNIGDEVTVDLLKYVNPIFAGQSGVKGVGDLYCEKLSIPLDKETVRDKMQLAGTLGIDDLKVAPRGLMALFIKNEASIRILPTKFTVADGYLGYDDMPIQVGNNPVNFGGKMGLKNRDIDMTVTFPWTIAGNTARVGEESAARISLPVEGTLDNPSINKDKLMETVTRKMLEEQLQKGLERIFR
jgi:hypothetical protein